MLCRKLKAIRVKYRQLVNSGLRSGQVDDVPQKPVFKLSTPAQTSWRFLEFVFQNLCFLLSKTENADKKKMCFQKISTIHVDGNLYVWTCYYTYNKWHTMPARIVQCGRQIIEQHSCLHVIVLFHVSSYMHYMDYVNASHYYCLLRSHPAYVTHRGPVNTHSFLRNDDLHVLCLSSGWRARVAPCFALSGPCCTLPDKVMNPEEDDSYLTDLTHTSGRRLVYLYQIDTSRRFYTQPATQW